MSHRGLLIGCGFFAGNHMNGWAQAEGAEIVAVCDLDAAKAQTMARQFGVTQVFTDAETALQEVRPDFVDVATTVPSHRMVVEMAFSHGAAVICQKPFAETLADAKAMVDAGERAGKPLFVHENFRWQAPLMALRDKLAEGVIGDPAFARVSFRHRYDVYAGQPYLAEVEQFALMDVGLHLFDVVRFLFGDSADLHCRTQSQKPGIAGEDMFLATLRQKSGAVVSVDCSFYTIEVPEPFPQTLIRVEGPRGTLDLTAGYQLYLHREGGVDSWHVEPPVPAWGEKPWHAVQDSVAAFEQHVVRVLDGQEDPQPSGAHNLGTLAMALAAYRSAETGETVVLDAFGEQAR